MQQKSRKNWLNMGIFALLKKKKKLKFSIVPHQTYKLNLERRIMKR
jgi:hypothetical protein